MGKLSGKFVLTGGPCAGKTSALAKVEEELTELGYKVIIVSESATELIKGGVKPFGDKALDILSFQKLIIALQLSKEKVYETASTFYPEDQKCVVIYDRGVLDNKAYIGQKVFDGLLDELNLNELRLMDNYDMVIHLVTAADGKEEYYTLENNAARTETASQARELDKKTMNAWAGHNNLKIIDNASNFEEKLNKVLEGILNYLGMPICLRKQRKYRVDLSHSDIAFMNEDDCIRVEIEQTYLKDSLQKDGYERRLRKRTYRGESTYYYTEQQKRPKGLAEVSTDKKITEKEYLKMLSTSEDNITIKKVRYTFARDKQHFKLDVFEDYNNFAILEVVPTNENQEIKLPNELKVIEEVTNNPDYQNYALSRKLSKEIQLEKDKAGE